MTRETRQIVKNEVKRLENIKPYSYDAYIKFLNDIIKQHPLTYFSLVKGRRFKLLWNDICKKTKFLDNYFSPNAATRVFYYINRFNDILHCETDGKEILKNISAVSPPPHFFCCNRCAQLHESTIAKTKETKFKNHGDPNWNNMEKNRQTCREHFGVDCSWQAEEVKAKSRQSIQDHYGVDHQMHSQEVKDGMKARYKEAHGVEYSFQNPEVQEKIKVKNQANFGVDWPMQNKELHKIMHENSTRTQRRNCFNNIVTGYENVEPMFTEDEFVNGNAQYEFSWKCKTCGTEFKQKMFKYGYEPRCFTCKPLLTDCASSSIEIEMFNFMQSIKGSRYECINGDILNWTTLKNRKQLDVICRRKDTGVIDLAFEFNGIYWHQIDIAGKGYHLNKTIECENLGIKLVHIWEDEWNKQDIKELISALLKDEHDSCIEDIITLDRSKHCRLDIPVGYEIIDIIEPKIIERFDNKGKIHLVEDCGQLICKKISC